MSVYDFSARGIDGTEVPLAQFRGRTLLIVNVASRCGFTPQYSGLEALQQKYGERGFAVLAFPCNQFGSQEPGTESEIREFCQTSYDVSFPLFAKIEVNGGGAHPLWKYLKGEKPGVLGSESIKWNFTKFLVGRDGQVVKRYAPQDSPESIGPDIERALAAPRA